MESTLGKIFIYIIVILIIWQIFDLLLFVPYNIINASGPNGCATDAWVSLPLGMFSGSILKSSCSTSPNKSSECGDLGAYGKYANKGDDKKPTFICLDGAKKIYNDAVSNKPSSTCIVKKSKDIM